MTNEALEHEVLPIMSEFKVSSPRVRSALYILSPAGSRHMCRMFREASPQCPRSVLPRAEGRLTPHGSSLRLPRSCAWRSPQWAT